VTSLGQRVDVVPDAIVRSPSQKRRVFIELDRSMKNLGRIRECLDPSWLRNHLLTVATDTKPSSDESALHAAAHRAYSWMTKLERVLEAKGMHGLLCAAEPALMKEGRERLASARAPTRP